MEYTEEQKRSFKDVFAKRRKAQILLAIPLVILIITFVVGADEQSGSLLGMPIAVIGPIFLALILGAVIFSFKNWRCPACNRYLGKVMNPRHCHSCGVELR